LAGNNLSVHKSLKLGQTQISAPFPVEEAAVYTSAGFVPGKLESFGNSEKPQT
jgi:hypothetical protein